MATPQPNSRSQSHPGEPTALPVGESAPPAPPPPVPATLIRDRAFVPVPLAQLASGARARLHVDGLQCESCELLNAMGLTDRCEIRVCKVGEPCIVQVDETRLGIPARLARQIMVTPVAAAPARGGG